MTDDAKLIEKTLKDDKDAFGPLVRRYHVATYALALQRIGSPVAAEEIAQDVFVTAYQKLAQLKDPTCFGAWLRSITLRQCAMWLRSQRRKDNARPLAEAVTAAHSPPVDAATECDEAPFGIEALIADLPEGLRAAAVLCLEDGVSPSVAAPVLGLKPGTLRKRLHDARARLQRRIVEKAEKELRMHLLPEDFAERCVCRCEKSQGAKARKEAKTMAEKKNCGCGCLRDSKRPTKTATKTKTKAKEKK